MLDFIIVVIVLVVLIVALVYIISQYATMTQTQIGHDVDRLTNIYDELLQQKSDELDSLKKELSAIKDEKIELESENIFNSTENKASVIRPVVLQTGRYIDATFFERYNYVRNEFHYLAKEATINTIYELSKVRRDINVHEYKEILGIFDFNLQYEMDTLESDDQLEVIQMISKHSRGKNKVVQRYMDQYKVFSFEGFISYLRDYIFYHDSIIEVYSYNGEVLLKDGPNNVVYKEDKTMGEGFVIKFRNYYYDFSIKGEMYE